MDNRSHDIKEVKSTCRSCAHGGCGAKIYLEEGKIVKIEGDKDHPISKGYFCNKGFASLEISEHPSRLTHPLKNIGERGSGRWVKISWEEAYEIINSRLTNILRKNGSESIAIATGTNRDFNHFVYKFANCLGTPNIVGTANECYVPRVAISKKICGGLPICDYENNPECVIIWGSNPVISNPDEYKYVGLADSLDKGAKLIVIDPRRTYLSSKSDHWLQIKPATDIVLALGMIKVIIEEEIYDRDFVNNYSYGFDQLKQYTDSFKPDYVDNVTRVTYKNYSEVARIFAESKSAAIHWGVGIEQNPNCISSDYALLNLLALTGNLDAPGGNVIFDPPPILPSSDFISDLERRQKEKILGKKYKLAAELLRPPPHYIWRTIITKQPYLIKAMLVFGTNLLLTKPNVKEVYHAIKELEFVVVADLFLTPTARLADIILPAASWLEQNNIVDYRKHHGYIFAKQKLSQFENCKSDQEILNEIGRRLKLPRFTWSHSDEALNEILKPAGITWEEFKKIGFLRGEVKYRKYRTRGFPTKSGKYEFFYKFIDNSVPKPILNYLGTKEDSNITKKYPFILITGARVPEFVSSEHRMIDSLRKVHPDPLIEINAKTAISLGINEGDWVKIITEKGLIMQRCKLSYSIQEDVVSAEYGWWYPEDNDWEKSWKRSNINYITDNSNQLDPLMGSTFLRGLRCNISKAG